MKRGIGRARVLKCAGGSQLFKKFVVIYIEVNILLFK